MESKKKSRDLSIYQYYQVLQMEWLTADLRYRLYPKKDKEYWNRVKEGKSKIINQIADKNHLPTIFIDDEMKRIFEFNFLGDEGLPKFIYKNEVDKMKQEPLDLIYYYNKGSEVRYDCFGEQKIGKIANYQPFKNTIQIEDESGIINLFDIKTVTRIL